MGTKTTKKEKAAPVAAKTTTKPAPKPKVAKKPASKAKPAVRKSAKKAEPAREARREDIETRAYFLARERQESGMPAAPLDDWLTAEREYLG